MCIRLGPLVSLAFYSYASDKLLTVNLINPPAAVNREEGRSSGKERKEGSKKDESACMNSLLGEAQPLM